MAYRQECGNLLGVIRNDSELHTRSAVINCLVALCAVLLWVGCASEKKPKPDSVWEGEMKNGQAALKRNDKPEADRFFQAALHQAELEQDDEHISASVGNLAVLRYSEGKFPEAEQLCTRQIGLDEKRLGTNSMVFADELVRFAELEEMLKKYERAEELYRQAQLVTVGIRGSSSPLAGVYLAKRAHLYLLLGKKTQARQFYARSLNFLEDAQYSLSFEENVLAKQRRVIEELARIRYEYAQLCEEDGHLKEAAELLDRGISSLESIHGKGCAQATEMFESQDRIQKKLEAQAKEDAKN